MKVSDILGSKGNAVATIRPEAKISTVVRRLKLEGIGAMVVSEDSVQVVGIISERDIVRGLVEDGADLLEKRVLDLMTSPVKTCTLDANIKDIMAVMTRSRIRHLPVVEEGRLVGIISIGDVVKNRLEEVEERYFALKELARKHSVEVDELAALRDRLASRLSGIDSGAERLEELDRQAQAAREAYLAASESLSGRRQVAAKALDSVVNAELPPLKLEKASFQTRVERLAEEAWSGHGIDRITFEVATNPGTAPGALARIASGGEMSRFLLALKVVLAQVGQTKTLVFDEVDSGVGGATAHAVGERLERLARDRQVLVVTHSPQVAARGAHHWRVHKEPDGERLATRVGQISAQERREEIARMLSGAEVTEEARAAADRLMGAA